MWLLACYEMMYVARGRKFCAQGHFQGHFCHNFLNKRGIGRHGHGHGGGSGKGWSKKGGQKNALIIKINVPGPLVSNKDVVAILL